MQDDDIRIGEILEPGDKAEQSRRERSVRRDFWGKLKRNIGRVPFAEEAVAAYYCALDPQTPGHVRGTLLAALAYFILPLDILPDFIVGLGFGDDLTVLAAAIAAVRGSMTDGHRQAARRALDDLKTSVDDT